MRQNELSKKMIAEVATGLGDLVESVVFVGGATTGLYIDDEAAPEVRVTDDVDFALEITSRADYAEFEGELRKRKFKHDTTPGAPICRWTYGAITVDAMPTDPEILGFSNRWYRDGMANRVKAEVAEGKSVWIFSVPYFIASKIEAFRGRGRGDLRTSTDFEDIVALLNGSSTIDKDLVEADKEVRRHISDWFGELLKSEGTLIEAVSCQLPRADATAGRIGAIMSKIRQVAQNR